MSADATRLVRESHAKQLIEQSRVRLIYVIFVFALCFIAIMVRLGEIALFFDAKQIEGAAPIDASQSDALQDANTVLALSRGDVVDRNGVVLATSLNTLSLFAKPKVMLNQEEAVKKIAGIFPAISAAEIRKRLRSNPNFAWIKRNLTPREQHAVNNLGIPGLYFLPEQKRIYPYGNLFSHVVGYTGIDNVGLAGVEKYFNARLRNTGYWKEPLQLSLDARLQAIVHDAMLQGIREFKAIGATGIVMDMANGEILAMSNLPDFNPHQPAKAQPAQKFNRASLGVYEMGSTFKTFTTAVALDTGTLTVTDGFDVTNPIKVASFTIRDTHPKKGWLSVPEIYAYSSNIGTVKMILEVGSKKQKGFLRKLGMLDPIRVELPERSAPLFPKDWKEINAMTISYGHGMAVSPLHLAHGIASVTYDGTSIPITLVKDGNEGKERERIVSEKTARQMRRLMRMVVQYGTAGKANVVGYRVGGKTGTAEKVMGKGYDKDAKLALFASIYPTDNPRYLVLVMVDEPKGNKDTFGYATGGWIAAPIAATIIKRMGPIYGLRPIFEEVPDKSGDNKWVQKASLRFEERAGE